MRSVGDGRRRRQVKKGVLVNGGTRWGKGATVVSDGGAMRMATPADHGKAHEESLHRTRVHRVTHPCYFVVSSSKSVMFCRGRYVICRGSLCQE